MSRRARREPKVRREEILTATVELLKQVGPADIKVAQVAASLGVSTSLVFYHFHSKDALVAEAFAHAFERDLVELDRAVEAGDWIARLRGLSRLFDTPGTPVGWQIWIDACAVGQREPEMQARLHWLDHRCGEAIRLVIEGGVADGVFSCPDPAASAARILALNDGLSTAVMVLRSVTRAQLRDWMTATIAAEAGISVELLQPVCAAP